MNGYFRLVNEANRTSIRLFAPTEGGSTLSFNDVAEYLTMKGIPYDRIKLNEAVLESAKEDKVFLLENKARHVERECYKFAVTEDKMQAYVRFYAPSIGGEEMTAEELVKDLEIKGIKHGIKRDVIDAYFTKREYCTNILIAEGTEPVQGKDAYIEYYFNTDKKAKPTLKEDGSVDFFQLNVVQHCNEGDVLAKLFPAERGMPGKNLAGELIRPREVKNEVLKFGNNIAISEDKTVLTSLVNGHVELVEDRVFVSDVLTVENVDTATGNIEYEGSVQVNGNVCTNFHVKAKGNIEVKGVVEGAYLEAGGNIIIARGMNGMGRGELKAEGNIIAKFLENVTAQAAGYVASESILHSHVMAGTEVNVDGKRGFITGGKVSAVQSINVKTLGSPMGADTTVEVGADPNMKIRVQQLQKQIGEDSKSLKSIQQVLVATKQKIAQGAKLTPEQLKYLQSLAAANQQKTEAINASTAELDSLMEQLTGDDNAHIIVRGTVYPGTKICIGDVSMVVQKEAQYSRFIKSRGDVKLTAI